MLQELMDVVIILMEGPNMLIGATNALLDHFFYMFILGVYKKMFWKKKINFKKFIILLC